MTDPAPDSSRARSIGVVKDRPNDLSMERLEAALAALHEQSSALNEADSVDLARIADRLELMLHRSARAAGRHARKERAGSPCADGLGEPGFKIPECCVVTDSKGHILDASAGAPELLGTTGHRLRGRSLLNLVSEADVTFCHAVMATALAGGRRACQLTLERLDGTSLPADVVVSPSGNANYTPSRLMWQIRDMTGVASPAERYRRLASFPEENPHPVLASDRTGHVTYHNPATARLMAALGVEAVSGILPVDHRRIVRKCLAKGQTVSAAERQVAGRTLSWSYQPHAALQVVHLYGIDATEARQASDRLAASETRYRRLFEVAEGGILLVDAASNVVQDANPWLLAALGLRADELIGRNLWDVATLFGLARSPAAMKRAVRDGHLVRHTVRLPGAGGKELDVEYSWSAFRLQGRTVLQCSLSDETTRLAAEAALRESEERYRTLFDGFPEPTALWNRDGVLLMNNAKAAANLRGIREDYLGRSIGDIHGPESAGYLERIARVIDTGVTETQEDVVERGGRTIWYWTCMQRVRIPDGSFATQVLSYDITALKRTELALRESEEKLRFVADYTYDWEYWRKPDGTFEYVSPACERISGRRPEEFTADPGLFLSIVHPEDLQRVDQHLATRAQDRGPADLAFRIIDALGHTRWIGHTCQPVHGAAGEYLGERASNRDITRQVEEEQKLHERTAQMEALRNVGLNLASQLDLDTLLQSIVSEAVSWFKVKGGILNLYRPELDAMQWTVSVGIDDAPVGDFLHRDEGFVGRVWQEGRALIVDDYQTWPGRVQRFAELPIVSCLGVPIRWGDEFLGVIHLTDDAPRRFTQTDAESLYVFAASVAIAIRNAKIMSGDIVERRRAEALVRATTALISTLQLEPLLNNLLSVAMEAASVAESGVVLLADNETGRLAVKTEVAGAGGRNRAREFAEAEPGFVQRVLRGDPQLVAVGSAERLTGVAAKVGKPVDSIVASPLTFRGRGIGVVVLRSDASKGAFTADDLTTLTAFAAQGAVAVEHARLFAEAGDKAMLEERQRRRAEALVRATAALISTLQVEPLLHNLLAGAMEAAPVAGSGLVLLTDRETGLLSIKTEVVRDGGRNLAREFAEIEDRFVESVFAGDPCRTALDSDGRVIRECLSDSEAPASVMAAPLTYRGRGIGVVVLLSAPGVGTFSEDDLKMLTAFAAQGAVAVENARLFSEAGEKAVLEERQRLARELHDSVTQALYGLTLFTHAASEWAQAGDMAQVTQQLDRIASTSQQVLKEMRLLVYELRPASLASEGLVGALRHRMSAVEHRAGVDAHLWAEMAEPVTPEQEDALYRVAQEALSNALKHAQAKRVDLWLRSGGGRVELVVKDDGCGFVMEELTGGGMGLSTMRERAERIGGQLSITSCPGGGTTISLEAPAPAGSPANAGDARPGGLTEVGK